MEANTINKDDSSPEGGMTAQLDNILEGLGGFGKFQIRNCILISIPLTVSAWYGLSFVFAVYNTPHRCYIPQCETGEFDAPWLSFAIPSTSTTDNFCRRYPDINSTSWDNITSCHSGLFDNTSSIQCDHWVYSDNNTIVSEFNLACQEWKTSLIGTANSIGQAFGLPISGIISDRYGRRTSMLLGVGLTATGGVFRSFCTNYWTYFGLEFFDGVVAGGIYNVGYILCVELFGPKHVVLVSSLISYSYAIGEILLGVIAWLFPYWRLLLRVLYIPTFLLLIYVRLIPESIRWLLSKKKYEEAERVLQTIAKFNKVELSPKAVENLIDQSRNEFPSKTNLKYIRKENIVVQLLKSRIMMVRVICCSLWWITCTFVYYGLMMNSVSISGNMHLNFILVSFIEIPGYFIYYFVIDKFGRRWSIFLSLFGSGVACFLYLLIPSGLLWLQLLAYMFGKFSITVAFTVLYIYSAELFPTSLRTSLISTCSMFGRIGSIIAPQTPLLGYYYKPLPLLLFGCVSIISGLTVLRFPETDKLPDTIEEAENLSKNKKKENDLQDF